MANVFVCNLFDCTIAAEKPHVVEHEAFAVIDCSKFLHFVLPDVFFIIDSISEKGGKTCIKLDKSDADRLKNIDKDKDTYAYYVSHILRAHDVACVLTEAGITPTEQVKVCISFTNGNPVCSMPRLVDSVLMK